MLRSIGFLNFVSSKRGSNDVGTMRSEIHFAITARFAVAKEEEYHIYFLYKGKSLHFTYLHTAFVTVGSLYLHG